MFLKTVQGAKSENITDQKCTMIEKTQKTQIKLEGESPSTKNSEEQKKSNQRHQRYQSKGCGGDGNGDSSGNSERGRSNLHRGSANQTDTPNQAFVG